MRNEDGPFANSWLLYFQRFTFIFYFLLISTIYFLLTIIKILIYFYFISWIKFSSLWKSKTFTIICAFYIFKSDKYNFLIFFFCFLYQFALISMIDKKMKLETSNNKQTLIIISDSWLWFCVLIVCFRRLWNLETWSCREDHSRGWHN